MRKVLVIAIASLYLLVSSGVVVNMHYCMGKLASLGIGHHDSKSCEKCGMDNNGCCKDEVKVVKLQDNQETSAGFQAIPKLDVVIAEWPAPISTTSFTAKTPVRQFAHAPPGEGQHSLQTLYCVFRI